MASEVRTVVTEAGLANVTAARDEAQALEGGVTGPGTTPGHVGQPEQPAPPGVRERMDVITSCGKKVGVVERVEGGAIMLAGDRLDGSHHFIPMDWIDRVDRHVHLSKDSSEVEMGWKEDAASCRA